MLFPFNKLHPTVRTFTWRIAVSALVAHGAYVGGGGAVGQFFYYRIGSRFSGFAAAGGKCEGKCKKREKDEFFHDA